MKDLKSKISEQIEKNILAGQKIVDNLPLEEFLKFVHWAAENYEDFDLGMYIRAVEEYETPILINPEHIKYIFEYFEKVYTPEDDSMRTLKKKIKSLKRIAVKVK